MDLKTHHDKIVNLFNKHIGHERDRASEAGSDREEFGKMLELCGLNKKATGWMKGLHKMEPDKRDDVLRSFDALRVELEKAWGGQRSGSLFNDDDEDDAVEPLDETLPAASYDDTLDVADEEPVEAEHVGDPDLQQEADDFEAALAGVE